MTIPIILSTGSIYNLDISTIMAVAAEVGFAGIELVIDWRWETHRLTHLESLMARYNLPILAVHSPFLNMPIHGWPDDPVDRVKQSVRLAEALGTRTIVVHPPERWVRLQAGIFGPSFSKRISVPFPLSGPGPLGRWLWHDLADFQARTRVKITVENMPCRPFGPMSLEPHYYWKPSHLNHFQYLTFDTTHVGTRHKNLLLFYRQVKSKVAHIHLSNYNGQEHQLLDDGDLPLAEFLRTLLADNFCGLIALELNAFDLQAEDERALRQTLQDNLAFCQNILASSDLSAEHLNSPRGTASPRGIK